MPPRYTDRFAVAARALLAAACLAAAGCGSDAPQVVDVSGTVTRNGQAVSGATIIFHPEHGRPSIGTSDSQGRYTLQCTRSAAGAVVGTHKVYVKFYEPVGAEAEKAFVLNQPLPKHPEQDAISAKYGTHESTPLVVEVSRAGQVIDLKLD